MYQYHFFDKCEGRIRANLQGPLHFESPANLTLQKNPNTKLSELMKDGGFSQHLVEALFPQEIRASFSSDKTLLSLPFIEFEKATKYNHLPNDVLREGVDLALYIDNWNRPGIAIRLIDKAGEQPDYFITYHQRSANSYKSHWVVGRNSNFQDGVNSIFYVKPIYVCRQSDQRNFAEYFKDIVQGKTVEDVSVDAFCPFSTKEQAATNIQKHVRSFLISRTYKKYQAAKKELLTNVEKNDMSNAQDSMEEMVAASNKLGLS